MIQMLKKREECLVYLTHISTHHWNGKSLMKRWNIRIFQPSSVVFISCRLTKVAKWGYQKLIPGDCRDWSTNWHAVWNYRQTWSGVASGSLWMTCLDQHAEHHHLKFTSCTPRIFQCISAALFPLLEESKNIMQLELRRNISHTRHI